MFRTKKDVDRHVQEILRKLKSEKERNLRCYNIAKLYFQVGDYENARRYVSSYLTVRDDSAIAHKLLGQIFEVLGQKEKAVLEYKCSLELESTQSDLVLKVCELLSETEVTMDLGRARYWCDRAEQLFPHHPAVFKLKEHLLSAKGEENLQDLESLITNELIARPTDLSLRIRLLRLYQDTGRFRDAYNHAIDVEIRSPFREELQWYECLNEVFKTYREKSKDSCSWDFYLYYTSSLEKVTYLSLCDNRVPSRHSLVECVQHLFSFDQILNVAAKQSPPASERELYQEFLRHMRGQLCLHLGTLILKRTKKDKSNWRESCRLVSPLLLLAMSPLPDLQASWLTLAADSRKKLVEWWVKEAAYRNSQAGHVLLSMVHERKSQFLDRVMQFCSGNWRERLFQRIFNTRDHQQAISTSYFVSYSGFSEPPLQLPSTADLRLHDEMSQQRNPKSLHHMVWLGLHEMALSKRNSGSKQNKDFCCHVFDGLQMTTKNMNSAGVETLNRLDIDAFLYSTVICVASMQEELQTTGYWSNEAPSTLPANLTDQLCTVQQDKWWVAAYSIFKNQTQGNLGELRQIVQRGIEVVRVLGNHGLDVRLIVQLARIFSERASSMSARTESAPDLAAVEARAALYWTSALPLLEKLQRNQAIRAPHTRLFEYQGKELSAAEVTALIEEGRFFLACQLMKEEKHERAIEAFEQLKSPYASFYSALIYKRLAGEQLQDLRGEMITSEMRSQHIILLTKARECFYLTLDRLKIPGVDTKHPLNGELGAHIEEIENQLHHIDPDVCRNNVNRNDVEALSGDSESSDHSQGGNINSLTGFANNGTIHDSLLLATSSRQNVHQRHSSTPYRSSHRLEFPDTFGPGRLEPRPSPERLDAQIRQLLHSRDTLLETVTQQSKSVLDNMKIIMDNVRDCKQEIKETKLELKDYNQELKSSKQAFNEVKEQVQELRKEILKLKKGQSHLNSELSQVCDPEDDLYVFDEEDYTDDMNMTSASHVGAYTTFQPFPNYPNYRPMSGIMGTSTVSYPPSAEAQASLMQPSGFLRGMESAALLYPPAAMSYYGAQGALPFSEGQQLPDFRNQPVPAFSRTAEEPKLPQSLVAPVNVVITSSDSLPTTTPINQPTLSVTIPPQHRLGGAPIIHTSTTPSLPQTGVPATISSKPAPSIPQTQAGQIVPHAFQISMPPQVQLPRASALMKEAADLSPVLPISTHSLLSSVPSPVYSAVVPDKSPSSKEPSPIKRVSTGSVAEEEEEEADHDPCPDYQPIIPLPAEVEVMTGEEEETVLFESRAKLFRFVEKEWKERGVGNIKILHNRLTDKVRILMRREQVLKVCANHLISPEMELVRMNNKAWIWVANDFADEAVVLEKLCVCFKTVDEAENFKDSFENAKSIMKKQQSPIKQTVSKPEVLPANTAPITTNTPVTTQTWTTTDTSKTQNVTSSDAQSKIKFGGFTFATAPTFKLNQIQTKESEEKVTDQKEDISKPSPFASFSFSTKSGVESLAPKEQAKPQTIVTETLMQNALFNSEKRDIGGSGDNPFASPQPNAFKVDTNFKGFEGAGSTVFGQKSVKESIVTKPEDESAGDGASEEFVPTTEFTPVIPLPELIEVKTGEEGEVVIFQERAKLLRFTTETKEWKERGIGCIKILSDPKTGKVRLLMRREQVLKVCCNHMLTTTMKFEFSSTSDRALHWAAQDYSEGEMRPELLAIRFKTVESAKHFKQVITDLQGKMIDRLPTDQNKSSSSRHSHDKDESSLLEKAIDSGGVKVYQAKPGSWECDSCYTQNEGNCNRCAACEVLKPGAEKPATNIPLSEVFKKKPGLWECSACYTSNDGGTSCVACLSSRPGFENETSQKKTEDKTAFKFGISNQTVSSGFSSSLFSNSTPNASFSFGVPAGNIVSKDDLGTVVCGGDSEKTNSIVEKKDNSEPTFLFGPGANKEASKITFTFGSKDSKSEADSSPQSVDRRFTFGSPSKFEFNFSGVKAITPVKSPKSPGTKGASSGGEDDSGSEVEDEADNLYFTPVIALPEKVPLHTGEEDETVLYAQHAKLFRFVNGEWKDRGIGDIKILEHKDNKKVRLLMRRDQVLKICLNHFLTSGLSFMKKDAKTWLWSAPDFSEGEINNEQFAVRFKNPEIAATFKDAIDKAQEKLRTNSTEKSTSCGYEERSAGELSSALKEFSFALPASNSAQPEPKFSLANRLGISPEVKKGVRSLFGGCSQLENKPVDDAVEVLYELSVTDEEKAEAERLLLPPNFFAYRKKPGCSGCPGCKDDQDSEVEETSSLRNTSQHTSQLTPNFTSPSSAMKTASFTSDTKSPDIYQQTSSTLNQSQDSNISSSTKNGQAVIRPATFSFTSSNKSESVKEPEFTFSWSTGSSTQNQQSNAQASSGTFITPPVFGTHGVAPAPPVFGTQGAAPAPPLFGAQSVAIAPPLFGAQSVAIAPPLFGAQSVAPAPPLFGAQSVAPALPLFSAQSAASTPPLFGMSGTVSFSELVVEQPTDTVTNKPPWEKDGLLDKASDIFSDSKSGLKFEAPKLSVQTTQSQSPLQSFSFSAGLSADKVGKTPGFDFKVPVQTGLELLKASIKADKDTEWKPSVSSRDNNEVVLPNTKESTTTLFCSNTPELSFASLSANAKSMEFGSGKTNTEPFEGQGSTVFKSTPAKTPARKEHGKTESDDSSGEEADDVSHDPHFEPAIALPDTVEIRTGEEDEEIVFMAHATLYRHSTETMEWKERGTGIMKILHDPAKNTFRLLLRREKVHKVVCNNLITPKLALLPFPKTTRAWIWAAHNFVDEEMALEKLAVRFRKEDAAQDFYNKVQECIEKLKTAKEPQASLISEVSTQEDSEDSEGYEDEDDDDDDDEEDDDDDDYVDDKDEIVDHESIGDSILYPLMQSRAQLFEFSNKWKTLGIGIVCIKYHSGSNGAVLSVHSEDSNKVICKMMIDQNISMMSDGVNCEWIGMNEASNTSTKFKAQFFSDIEAQEFERAFSEGMDLNSAKELHSETALGP